MQVIEFSVLSEGNMHVLKITKNDASQRLDKFLLKALRGIPPALMYKYIRTKKIKLNGKRAEQNAMLCEGDEIILYIKDEFFAQPGHSSPDLAAIRPRLSIVYEDENLIICNKRPGVLVHEDKENNENTLISHIKAYLYQKGEYDPTSELSFAPALCNRIDRNTGGLVIAAKNAESLRILNEMIKARKISKYYICAVHGIPTPAQATLKAYLKKDSNANLVRVTDNRTDGSKEIITRYSLLSKANNMSLLYIELITGRTHQIRAHMAHIGHPLVGDGKYSVNEADRKRGYKHQALYAFKLVFDFSKDAGILSYLDGKSVSIDPQDIFFVSDFPSKDRLFERIRKL